MFYPIIFSDKVSAEGRTYILINAIPEKHGLIKQCSSGFLDKCDMIVTLDSQRQLQSVKQGHRTNSHLFQLGAPG